MKIKIPNLKTVSPNLKEHWGKSSKRHSDQRLLLRCFLKMHLKPEILPCTITLTRIAPRQLDYDNLVTSFKHCRDTIADMLIPGLAFGRADGDARITWNYEQRRDKAREYGVEVDIEQD